MDDGLKDGPARQVPRLVQTEGLHLCIRPVTPDDRTAIREGLATISPETTYRRFFVSTFSPDDRELRYLTEVDGQNHVALGAEDCTANPPRGTGVARYVRLPDAPSVAEAAVIVVDAYQRRGIGSLLLAALSKRAAECELEHFRSYVLAENTGVIEVLRALGAIKSQAQDGVLQLDVPIYSRHQNLPARPELERIRWAWRTIERAEAGDCETGSAS